MIGVTLAVPIAFLALAAIVLWYLIGTPRGKWTAKLLLIVTVPFLGIAIWRSLDSYLGWPTVESLPKKFVLLWVDIQEPDPKIGDSGNIYLWIRFYEPADSKEILGYNPEPQEPRAYRIPYARQWHEQLQGAKQMIMQGKTVVLEFGKRKGKKSPGGEPGDGGEDGRLEGEKDKDGKSGTGSLSQEQEFRFYELPPPKLPDKNRQ